MKYLAPFLALFILIQVPAYAFSPIKVIKKTIKLPFYLTVGAVGGTYAAFNYFLFTEVVDLEKVLYEQRTYPQGETKRKKVELE